MFHRALSGVVLLTILAGCGSGTADSGDTLEIWIRKPPGGDAAKVAQSLADAFTKGGGVKTKVTALFDDFETKLQQQAAQKDLPDIVINDAAQLGTMQTQGLLREVDQAKLGGADQVAPTAWKAATAADGKAYGVPFSAQSMAIIIRKDWREKVGLQPPASWDDLTALAKAFTEKDPDGNGQADTAGFAAPAGTKRGYASWFASSLIYANGGDFLTRGGDGKLVPAVAQPDVVEAVKYLQDQFCTHKTVNAGAVSNDTNVTHEVFEKGQAGIYLTGPYMLARFVKSLGTDKLEVVPVPNGPSGGPGTLGEGENIYLMAGSGRQDAQRAFAEFAISAEGQRIGMAKDSPGSIVRLPVNTTVDLAAERQDPRWKVFADVYATAVYSPPVPNWTPLRQVAADAMNAVWANCTADVQTAMSDLSTKLGAELQAQKAS